MDELKHIIVIGASAGGFNSITNLLSKLPANLPTAIFVVMHLAKSSSAAIIQHHIKKFTSYQCYVPKDEDEIKPGTIYIAPPDFHLLLKKDKIRLIKGPHENRWRPSIDVLFRSAAAAFNSQVIGIVLSGMLDDGTSGMAAIKRCGGLCIVQEPGEAPYADMPNNVLNNVDVDHRVPVADMGYIIDDIFSKPTPQPLAIPEDVKLEAEITERMVSSITELQKLGTHSNYTCPDCGGGLWEVKDDSVMRYRCHTGHVYTQQILADKQAEQLEESLWISIRMMEERRNMLQNMASRQTEGSYITANDTQLARASELNTHIERLKSLMVSISKDNLPVDEGYN